MNKSLDYYLAKFARLRTDRGNQWAHYAPTRFQAPHKPLLLLSILDRLAEGSITTNLIELDTDLAEIFQGYWAMVMPVERRSNFVRDTLIRKHSSIV